MEFAVRRLNKLDGKSIQYSYESSLRKKVYIPLVLFFKFILFSIVTKKLNTW